MGCLEIQRTERPMIAKGKRQIPLHNETFLREWFSTFLTKRLNMLCVGYLTHPKQNINSR